MAKTRLSKQKREDIMEAFLTNQKKLNNLKAKEAKHLAEIHKLGAEILKKLYIRKYTLEERQFMEARPDWFSFARRLKLGNDAYGTKYDPDAKVLTSENFLKIQNLPHVLHHKGYSGSGFDITMYDWQGSSENKTALSLEDIIMPKMKDINMVEQGKAIIKHHKALRKVLQDHEKLTQKFKETLWPILNAAKTWEDLVKALPEIERYWSPAASENVCKDLMPAVDSFRELLLLNQG